MSEKTLHYTLVETEVGWVGLIGSEAGLRWVLLPQPSPAAVAGLLEGLSPDLTEDASAFGDLPDRMKRYFTGERVSFPDNLDLRGLTPFQRAVSEATRSIPYGETRSYAWVARRIGKPRAVRAVGQAEARNRLCIVVPCHRVVGSDGSLRGFGGGPEMKRRLLEMEALTRPL